MNAPIVSIQRHKVEVSRAGNMRMENFSIRQELRPYIKKILVLQSSDGSNNRVLPTTGISLALNLEGAVAEMNENGSTDFPGMAISGLRNSARIMQYSKSSGILLVIFEELGAGIFINIPLHELFGEVLAFDQVFPKALTREIEDHFYNLGTVAAKVSWLQDYLVQQIKGHQPDLLVAEAIRLMNIPGQNTRVKEILPSLNISRDAFEKRFRKVTGASPKQFATIKRLHRVIALQGQVASLTELAYEAGYFDQAHFIHDFKKYTGKAPAEFFMQKDWW